MVIICTVIATLIVLFVTMFILGYRKSKKAIYNKELAFREELIEHIENSNGELSDDQKKEITTLPGRKLTTYLQDNDLITHTIYNTLLKKHFDSL